MTSQPKLSESLAVVGKWIWRQVVLVGICLMFSCLLMVLELSAYETVLTLQGLDTPKPPFSGLFYICNTVLGTIAGVRLHEDF